MNLLVGSSTSWQASEWALRQVDDSGSHRFGDYGLASRDSWSHKPFSGLHFSQPLLSPQYSIPFQSLLLLFFAAPFSCLPTPFWPLCTILFCFPQFDFSSCFPSLLLPDPVGVLVCPCTRTELFLHLISSSRCPGPCTSVLFCHLILLCVPLCSSPSLFSFSVSAVPGTRAEPSQGCRGCLGTHPGGQVLEQHELVASQQCTGASFPQAPCSCLFIQQSTTQ